MASTIPTVPKAFSEVYARLLRAALWRRVPYQDAEEIVSDVLLKAITAFDASRGQFEPFCRTILHNRVANYFRSRQDNPIGLDGNEKAPSSADPQKTMELNEVMREIREIIEKVFGLLTKQERQFLLTLEEVLAEQEKSTVSETARKLGLTPQEGWNIMRRIQRKAERLRARVEALELGLLAEEEAMPSFVKHDRRFSILPAPSIRPERSMALLLPTSSLFQLARLGNRLHQLSAEAAFYRLDETQRQKLSQLFR